MADPEALSKMSNICTVCQKEGAKACLGCQDTPILPFDFHNPQYSTSIYYCGTECQKTHWKDHRRSCATHFQRRTLYRAASTLQQIYYIYRQAMFDKYIVKIEERGDKLYIYEGDYREFLSFDGVACVFPFPEKLCETGGRKDKEAVLATLACADSMVAMHELIELFLGEIAHLSELTIMLKDPPRETIILSRLLSPSDTVPPHGLTRIELKTKNNTGTGEVYALDLASAQYGWYDPLTEWDEYAKRVHVVEEKARFGATRRMHDLVIKQRPQYAFPLEFGMAGAQGLRGAVGEWLGREGWDVKAFLEQKKDVFDAKQKELLDFMHTVMQAKISTLEYEKMRQYVSVARRC